jgi:NAD(P)-dependent dehydrogenase (short-subunit alcohol dehydrogenase family)
MPTALIIGASRGLGRALAEEHLKRGWSVIATVRDAGALADLDHDALRVERLDTTDWAAVDGLAAKLEGTVLDLLFVNAGISGPTGAPIGAVDPDAFTELMLTNSLAPLRLIDKLMPRTRADATIAVMSSGMGSIAQNGSGGWEAYRMSKAALNMGLKSMEARDTASRTWLAITPGWVRTDMGGAGATLRIEESIPRLVDMLERRRETGGCTFVDYKDDVWAW